MAPSSARESFSFAVAGPTAPPAHECLPTLGSACTNSAGGEQRQRSKSQLGIAFPFLPWGDLPELVLAEVHGGHGVGAHGIEHGLRDLGSLLVTGTGVTPISHCLLINRALPPSSREDEEQNTGNSCRKPPALPHAQHVTKQDFFPFPNPSRSI